MNLLRRQSAAERRLVVRRRTGFTLVEMLAVIAIIAILASILLGALQAANRKSKEARTKSLIAKMHNMLMARWDAYRTIRLPIPATTSGNSSSSSSSGSSSPSSSGAQFDSHDETQRYRQNLARRRMLAMRELLRMEMPDRYADLSTSFVPAVLQYANGTPIRPYLWQSYRRKIADAKDRYEKMVGTTISDTDYYTFIERTCESCECLYLILTTGIDDSSVASEHFNAGDFGDFDHDGMLEIHDAWENPIEFLRWAPGFESPAQPYFRYKSGDLRYSLFDSGTQPTDPDDPSSIISRWQIKVDNVTAADGSSTPRAVVLDQDDPFNPLRVGPTIEYATKQRDVSNRWLPGMPAPEYGFLLIPLIYSYGPDFQSGITHCSARDGYSAVNHPKYGTLSESDPYNKYTNSSGGVTRFRGDSLGTGYEYDNINNHELVLR